MSRPCSFYTHLFEIEPSCKPLFRNSLKSQGRALVKMIQLAVSVSSGLLALRARALAVDWPALLGRLGCRGVTVP